MSVLEWYRQTKLHASCKRCGLMHQAVMEYHHVDAKTKRHTISSMVRNGMDITEIQKEMAKCVPLCSNCHKIVHYNEERGIVDNRWPNEGMRAA